MNILTHEQAIQFLHEAAQQLSADQQADLVAHLAACDQCRAYTDQLTALQPRLTHALHSRRYAHPAASDETVRAILQHKRRSFMRKQTMAIIGTIVVAAFALIVVSSTRTPNQSWAGAQLAATITSTVLPSPTPTRLPTATPLSSPLLPTGADRFEPNDNFDQATLIDMNVKYDHLNFAMLTPNADGWDSDYFKVRVKPGMSITCRTSDLSAGTDTNLILYDESRNGLEGNDNANPTTSDKSSSVTYTVTYDGWLYVLVGEGVPRSPAEAQQATYSLECVTPSAAVTTPAPSDPVPSSADRFEPNDDFDQATSIDLNVKYDRLNFAMLTPTAGSWDNDYFKVRVKPGMLVTCHTLDLSPGTDTNLILYDGDRNGINGSDDVNRAAGDLSSSVTYTVQYEGWLYVLVGEGVPRSPAEAQQATYSLECSTGAATPPLASVPIKFPKIDRHPASWGGDDTPSPSTDILPPDEAQAKELGKNPGLGIRSLHAKGITGQGVGLAIIDQPLIVEHQEYADRMQLYEEINIAPNAMTEMHGPAVASLAVGKTVGVAPEADLYYIACYAGDFDTSTPDGFTYNFHYIAQGIHRILDVNRQLPEEHKIRVISISVGWSPEQKGYDEVMAAVKDAKAAGILVVSSSLEETFGFKFQALGRAPLADPDKFDSYEPGLFWADHFYTNTMMLGNDHLLVPMDSRTTASPSGPHAYTFYREGGWSWSIPYIAGMYALAAQVKPSITPDEFWSLALKTGRTIQLKHQGETIPFGSILDPVALIERLQTK